MEPLINRISPSGPVIGDDTTPPLVSGTANPPDGSVLLGREWIYAGSGTSPTQIPGSATAEDIEGLGALEVDMRAGYSYDIDLDIDAYGTYSSTAASYTVTINASTDDGATFPTNLLTHKVEVADNYMYGRTHVIVPLTAGASTIDHLQLQISRVNTAGGDMVYNPPTTIVRIVEFTRPS